MVKVLLIEQEALYQKAFSKMIEQADNCQLVGVAESEKDAMRMVSQFRPQIVFSEVILGRENGIEICRKLQDSFPGISTFALSNFRNAEMIDMAMKAGLKNYLLKPVSDAVISQICEGDHFEMPEENVYLKNIILSLEERDYRQSYEKVKEYVVHMFSETDAAIRRETLKRVISVLLNQIPGIDSSQQKYYLQKYRLTSKILSSNVLTCCWIMDIITEVYRQLCVMKYSHMNKVLHYIEENINEDISLVVLSAQAGVSSGYLSRIFKKYYRISVVDYIHLRKLMVAKKYMVSSEMNISDISFLLGYSEPGYFCKIFKKYEKMTPSAFCHSFIA